MLQFSISKLTVAGCLLAMTSMVPGATVRPAKDPEVPVRAPMNILWIISDDHGPELGCYGTPGLETPNLDRLAATGLRFTNAHTTSPICSPSRSGFMTGMYQTSINAHHHRSNRDKPLEGGVRPVTELFREAGWFTANDDGAGNPGKTDLNFHHGPLFDGVSWREREPGQPFFAQVNIFQPHRPFVKAQVNPVDPDTLTLPPYYPDDPILREDLAQYYDSIHLLDRRVGIFLDKLEADGLADNTIVIFFGDNGRPFARDKQFLYTGGTHVPLIIHIPGEEPDVRDDLVSIIDVTAQTLAFAGIDVPEWMEGRPFLEPGVSPRSHLYSARDRGDETEDRIRAVRNHDYNYIRNFYPDRPYLQFNAYKQLSYPDWRLFLEMAEEQGDEADFLFLHSTRPPEEL
ncbi:MAG: sulfatase [Candidatus Sumerlaeia bacterium]|nr:sulfatase [Candidatus Sumerlaeia bacterium]